MIKSLYFDGLELRVSDWIKRGFIIIGICLILLSNGELIHNEGFNNSFMGKKIYVNGSLIIETQYFLPKDIWVGYSQPPEGAIIVEPEDEVDGHKCMLIDEDHPQSLFNEYYAKDGAVSGYLLASYISSTYMDSFLLYRKRIGDAIDVIKMASEWPSVEKLLLYKMAYVNILTTLDAYICYVILKRSLDDEALFKDVMYELAPKSKKDKWDKLIACGKIGEWEQDAIRYTQRTSFLNVDTIDKTFKSVKFLRFEYNREQMNDVFQKRNLLVHRNGRQRNDEEYVVTYNILAELVNDCHSLAGAIFDSILYTLEEKVSKLPPEKDIKEVFLNGVIHAPFKLSDLARFFSQKMEQKAFEPIQMPLL